MKQDFEKLIKKMTWKEFVEWVENLPEERKVWYREGIRRSKLENKPFAYFDLEGNPIIIIATKHDSTRPIQTTNPKDD